MHSIDISRLKEMVNGSIIRHGNDDTVTDVIIDSRLVSKGSVFFALPGSNFDGHDFVKKAYENGASAAVVTHLVSDADLYQIKVEDTLKALYLMARRYKEEFDIPFISLTGSAGKTSTKDMVKSVLSKKYKTMKTIGNYNSTTGVPLTLFNLDKSHEVAVIEMGMNHKGEIEQISELVRPDFAMITNVGVAHIETLGSKENIFKAKMEITKGLKKGGTLVVNGDSDFLKDLEGGEFNIVKIGIKNGDFKAYDIKFTSSGADFKVKWQGEEYSFRVNTPANYAVYNALYAIYTGFNFGLDYEQIKEGLLDFKSGKNRMDIEKCGSLTFIDDTYNSNPAALKEALSLLINISGNNRKVAVLGDMLGLGEKSGEEHFKCGEFLAQKGIDVLLTLGEGSKELLYGALSKGLKKENAVHFSSKEELLDNIYKYIKQGDYILFKASRAMAFNEIVEEVKKGGKF